MLTSSKLSANVAPTSTVQTRWSTAILAFVFSLNKSCRTTSCPPMCVWSPGVGGGFVGGGVVGGGVVAGGVVAGGVVPGGVVPGGVEPVPDGTGPTLPLGIALAVWNSGGIEKGSRAPARTTGGSVSRGVGLGDTVGI